MKSASLTAAICLLLATVSSVADIPRTSSGKPDLSGTYNVATLTPLERPEQYGDKLTITPEEAKQIAEYWNSRLAKDSEKSDADREAPPDGGVDFFIPEFNGAAGKVGGYNAFYIDLGNSTFMLDGAYRTSIITDPPSGRRPALSEAGMQRMMAQRDFFHENTGTAWWIDREVGPYDHPELRPEAERCIFGFGSTAGPPALPVMYNNHKRIVQTDTHVIILNEMNHDARVVRINAEHRPDHIRTWLGDSIGHWEGDTLVVDTTNFNDNPSMSGGTRDLHVIERFSRIDDQSIRYAFTVEDPTWTAPWSGEYPWPASDNKVYEYACHEGNYALGGILRGARLLEKEALAERGKTGAE